MIKESFNLTGWKAQLATPNQEAVSQATFPWWLSPCKKSKRSIGFFQRYRWSNNSAIWLDKRPNWPYLTKKDNLRWYSPLMTDSVQKKLHVIPSENMDDQGILHSGWTRGFNWQTQSREVVQRILQSDWTRGTTGPTRPKVVNSDVIFH